MLRRRVTVSIPLVSSPLIRIVPLLGVMRRLIIFRVVVFPQPDGPSSTHISPSGTFRLTLSTALNVWPCFCENCLVRFSSFIIIESPSESVPPANGAATSRAQSLKDKSSARPQSTYEYHSRQYR